jgi:hypothetical protein
MAGYVAQALTGLSRLIGVRQPEVHQLRGLRVVVDNSRPDIETADVLHRLDEALALIELHEPQRFRHLQRDLHQIIVARYPCRGAYFSQEQTCLTELTFLARRDISAAIVASSVLHEGVHARVDRFRHHFGGYDGDRDAAREERLCRTAELRFGRALPPDLGAPVIERAQDSLALDDADVAPTIDWEVARARQEAADASAQGRGTTGTNSTPEPA